MSMIRNFVDGLEARFCGLSTGEVGCTSVVSLLSTRWQSVSSPDASLNTAQSGQRLVNDSAYRVSSPNILFFPV